MTRHDSPSLIKCFRPAATSHQVFTHTSLHTPLICDFNTLAMRIVQHCFSESSYNGAISVTFLDKCYDDSFSPQLPRCSS